MTDVSLDPTATAVRDTLLRCLADDRKTREPMNALVMWTELGKGLAGTLAGVSGEPGLLRKMICSYGSDHGTNVDLSRWAYRLEAEERLDRDEIAMGLQRVEDQLSEVLSAHIDKADASPDARRALFVAVVKGWFPVGLDIMHALPAGAAASEEALLGALSAWCERHLPEGEGEPLVGAPMEAAPAGEAPGVGTKPRRPPVVKAG